MRKAPLPANENQRLQTLLDFGILDTAAESSFDEIVVMASKICGTPIALISLIDKDRQWFKAKVGLDADETPRDISFCGHAITSKDLFEISNALHDDRFSDNPFVTGDLNLRFYAGAPLIASNGHALGTLCVIDHEEKTLTHDQKQFLEILSKQVVDQIEMRRNFRELQELTKKVIDQTELIRSQEKLAVIGKLAAGVSHEINNPLAIISGTAQVVRTLMKRGDDMEKILFQLQRIDDTVLRLTKVGKALRAISGQKLQGFSTPDEIERTFYDLMEEAKKAG